MKTRLLIIIGILVVSGMSLSYYVIYEQSTTVFITCDPRYTQIEGKCIRNLEQKIEKVVADVEGADELRSMLSYCAWNDTKPLINKIWQNDTHTFSIPECEWQTQCDVVGYAVLMKGIIDCNTIK